MISKHLTHCSILTFPECGFKLETVFREIMLFSIERKVNVGRKILRDQNLLCSLHKLNLQLKSYFDS